MRLAIQIPRTRVFAALALGAAFLALVVATVAAQGLSSQRSASGQTLDDIAQNPSLRFGSSQAPPRLSYAPIAVTPPAPPPASTSSPYSFIWPNDYYLVQGMWAGHPLGVDIGSPSGDPVRAVRDGRVIFAGGDACCSYGYFVIVEHDEGWSSLYAHFSQIDVQYGDEVTQGQVIGLSGGTGVASGPHVHFELRHYGGVVDPLAYLEPHRDWAVTAELLAERNSTSTNPAPAAEGPPGGAGIEASESAATTAPPAVNDSSLNASGAIMLGAQWLARQEESAYFIDVVSCVAAQTGPNWWVTCDGRLQGCRSAPDCVAQLTACVFNQPRMVTAACP